MNDLKLIKAIDQKAEKICKHVDLEDESKSLLKPGVSLSDFMQTLLHQHALRDVIRVISQSLPPREAVYWATLCVRDVIGEKPKPEDAHAVKAAEQWLFKPDEPNRQLNHQIAEKLEHATASAWVSMAIFWSGGSITPPGEAKVEPPEGLYGKAVTGAVLLASAHEDPKQNQNLQQRFIKRGIHIIQGGKGDNV